jgi:sugar/nucleoside kinase (ribokinase family)
VATAVVAAAQWGLRTRYIGAAGSDQNANLHQLELRTNRIESHLQRVPGAESRLSYILVEQQTGSRAVLCHRDSRLQLARSYLKKQWFQRSRLVHVDGENLEASQQAGIWAREAGVPVMCDLDVFCEDLLFLLPQVDFPVLSLNVLLPLGGSKDPLVALPNIRAKYGSRLSCTTMGERGALAWDGQRFFYAPAYDVPVVDTTGAGDLFHAGFAYGLLQVWNTQRLLEFACAAAGLNCMAPGARGGIGSPRTIERLRSTRKRHPSHYSLNALGLAAQRVLGSAGRGGKG